MSAVAPALLVAAAGVGFGHAVLPDHWVPLAVVGRTKRYPLSRVTRLAALAGVAHVLVSILLGAVIVLIGLQFRASIESAQDTIVGSLLILTALGFGGFELTDHGHHHGPGGHTHGPGGHTHDHPHHHDHDHAGDPTPQGRRQRLLAVRIPFGAAASPDLTILPVFLAAATVGGVAAVGTVVVFGLVTIATIVALTALAFLTGYRLRGNWLDRWGNLITAGVLLVIGVLVMTHVI